MHAAPLQPPSLHLRLANGPALVAAAPQRAEFSDSPECTHAPGSTPSAASSCSRIFGLMSRGSSRRTAGPTASCASTATLTAAPRTCERGACMRVHTSVAEATPACSRSTRWLRNCTCAQRRTLPTLRAAVRTASAPPSPPPRPAAPMRLPPLPPGAPAHVRVCAAKGSPHIVHQLPQVEALPAAAAPRRARHAAAAAAGAAALAHADDRHQVLGRGRGRARGCGWGQGLLGVWVAGIHGSSRAALAQNTVARGQGATARAPAHRSARSPPHNLVHPPRPHLPAPATAAAC